MVKEISWRLASSKFIHHPGKLDGAFSLLLALPLAHHLVHQSAQGGWGLFVLIAVRHHLLHGPTSHEIGYGRARNPL